MVYSYVSGLNTWISKEMLPAAELNANFSLLNTGLDDLQDELADSMAASDIRMGWKLPLTSVDDSIITRYNTTIPVFWFSAFGDSIAANDSLTIAISKVTPIGNAQGLWVKNTQGKPEKVALIMDVLLPNNISKLDSVRFKIWTELNTAADFVSMYVYDDSTSFDYKVACDSTGSKCSATARTAQSFCLPITQDIVGGRFRIKTIIQTNTSDSLFISPLEIMVTNR